MRVLMVAGESSGDMHGAGVVRAIRRSLPDAEIFGVGGDAMKAEGMEIVQHLSSLAVMGFIEVLRKLGTIRSVDRRLRGLLETRRPHVAVLIDYPGFNLRFAETLKRAGIPVVYYISPQVWAWHRGRVRHMKKNVDRMLVVFPFEVDIYREAGVPVDFVGHPLAERIGSTMPRPEFFRRFGLDPARRLLGLFPGSRPQEIHRILPVMLRAAEALRKSTGVQVAVSVAPNLEASAVRRRIPEGAMVLPVENATYDLMHYADAGIVTSGTATLEMGWFGTPMVVVYRTSLPTYLIGRALVRVPAIGLVNIVAGKMVVPELIQHKMTPQALTRETERLLDKRGVAETMRRELAVIRERLGPPGASERVAEAVLKTAGIR